jgi:hypothetical protein
MKSDTLPTPPEIGRVQIAAGWASHGCCVVFVLCRPERRKEKRGWAWVTESTMSGERGKAKKKLKISISNTFRIYSLTILVILYL